MSIEYYVEGFQRGVSAGVERQRVLDCFGPQTIAAIDREMYRLVYDAKNRCDMSLTEEQGKVTGACIYSPCDHERFNHDLFRLLNVGPFMLFAPDGNGPIVAQETMREHIPADLIEDLGDLIVVTEKTNIANALFD